ncbi:MAG: BofC C-terminal domain-containing protein [bacterium]|nr:BofC C-terminal domain-containing protein [bacterium]
MIPRRRLAVILVVVAATAVTLGGVRFLRRSGRTIPAPPVKPAVEEILREDAVIIWRIEYQGCGTIEEFPSPAAGMAGWSRDRLAAAMPAWRLEDFSPTGALFTRNTPGLCPDMQLYRTVGLHEGRVAVYYGRPPHLMLKEVTAIHATSLSEKDRRQLEDGIVVRGDEAVLRLLEGLDN